MDILKEEHSYLTELKAPNCICDYKWTIKNYNVLNEQNGKFIMSPMFQSSGITCHMKLYPRGRHGHSDYVSASLYIKDNKDIAQKVSVDFNILNDNFEIGHTGRGIYHPYRDNCPDICCYELIKRDVLLNAENKLLVDNQLTIICTVTHLIKLDDAPIQKMVQLEKYNEEFSLSNNLKDSLNNQFLADITLVTNGEKLLAHKLILASRSPVFAAMLQNNMKEKENSIIEIDDVSVDVLSKMLEFMYSDKVENITEHDEELVYIANKYDIKGLKLLSELSILSSLNIENFVKAFMLAETHCCDTLKQEVLKFIIKNAFEITKEPQFKSWKKELPAIVVDIIKAHA